MKFFIYEQHTQKSYLLSYHERYKIVNNEDRKERVNVKYCTFHINKQTKRGDVLLCKELCRT